MTFLQNNVKITMFVKEYIKSNFFPFVKKEKYAAYLLNKEKNSYDFYTNLSLLFSFFLLEVEMVYYYCKFIYYFH